MPENGERDAIPPIVDASQELRESYLDYSMHVILHRALPDVRDGLKPVHRRILYSMNESGLTSKKPYMKAAAAVGDIMGRYHPHGDSSIYDALVRMAQPFSLRYPLIDGHGNFGSDDGAPAAAFRYTEARLHEMADLMLDGIGEKTVDMARNYDESRQEPLVLPCRFPNLLVNGSEGIAVGMVTKMPPHNLREIVRGLVTLIDNPKATTADLMKHVKGPDFPSGGTIVGKEGIKDLYESGEGRVVLRAKFHTEESRGKVQIVVTEMPFQAKRAAVISKWIAFTKAGKSATALTIANGIAHIQDETGRDGVRLVIELRKDADPARVLAALLKERVLQQFFDAKNLCLVRNEPKKLGLKQLMEEYIAFQVEVIHRRSQERLRKVEERLHVLEGLLVAFQNIDKVIAIAKSSNGKPDIIARMVKAFRLTEIQADAVVTLEIYRISKVDVGDFRIEYDKKKLAKKELEGLIKSEAKKKAVIREDLEKIASVYGDARRTAIQSSKGAETEELDVAAVSAVADERTNVLLTRNGYVKRVAAARFQGSVFALDAGDEILMGLPASTLDEVWFLTANENANFVPADQVFPQDRAGRGKPLSHLVGSGDVTPRWAAAVPKEHKGSKDACLVTGSAAGLVKRTPLDQYESNRSSIVGFKEKSPDLVVAAAVVGADEMLLVAGDDGMVAHFPLDGGHEEVPVHGRAAAGVAGIKVSGGSSAVPFAHYPSSGSKDALLLLVTEHGFGRLTPVSEFPVTRRGVKGVRGLPMDAKRHGRLAVTLAVAKAGRKGGTAVLLTAGGVAVRVPLSDVPVSGRAVRLGRVAEPPDGDRFVAAFLEA